MPQKVIKFKGINRVINEFQTSGECEELINLRPDVYGGHKVIRQKKVLEANVDYDSIYEHTYGEVYNRLAITDGVITWIKDNGDKIEISSDFHGNKVSLSSAGNVLVIYCEDEKRQAVYKFEDNEYKPYNVFFNQITDAEIWYEYNPSNPVSNAVSIEGLDANSFNETINKAASGFYAKYPNGLCGASVVGCTYELEDGTEMWSTAFIVANISRYNGYKKPHLDTSGKVIVVTGSSKTYLTLTFKNPDSVGVKRINVYASRPVFPYSHEQTSNNTFTEKTSTLEEMSLAGQIMYYQGSIAPDRQVASLLLNFGSTQAGEKLMDVTSGCIERIGDSVSYNNRFHFYRSEVNHILQVPTTSDSKNGRAETSHWAVHVQYNGEWKLIDKVSQFSENGIQDFIYPMLGVKRLAFIKGEYTDGDFYTDYSQMFFVNLKDSSAYNYSYAFDVTPQLEDGEAFKTALIKEGAKKWGDSFDTKALHKKETNVINVSSPYNPFSFPVKYSYGFGGEILDVATSYLPISSTQVGQYPLSVFTSNGIFALEQGDGSTLYSNITPLQPIVIRGKATTSPHGTFFISSDNLYLLAGRDAAKASYALEGDLELGIRENDAYKKLYCKNNSTLYNFEPLLSKVDFENFISSATLTYDQLQNELYISNADYPYSYVLNLGTKEYHKVARRYLNPQNGARYAIEVSGNTRNVVDLHTEEKGEQNIFLQSRPMPLDAAFTHIHRLIMFADAKLEKDQNLCISVFASDNLYDWKCIISSQKHDTVLRQIRTNRAAKSYRDYVIIISGTVHTDTDLSDLIADYTVVARRLG